MEDALGEIATALRPGIDTEPVETHQRTPEQYRRCGAAELGRSGQNQPLVTGPERRYEKDDDDERDYGVPVCHGSNTTKDRRIVIGSRCLLDPARDKEPQPCD